jgi:hypothetical protein
MILVLMLVCNSGCLYRGVVAEAATRPEYVEGGPPAEPLRYRLSGPLAANNLTLFLIHRDEAQAAPLYLSLQQAMRDRRVTVSETGDVGELALRNRSDNDVFIQSGEIVKGGRQDRTIAEDFILPRDSGKLAIESFCVESGRWERRGSESASTFSGSSQALVSKDMKLAARLRGSQGEVWNQVSQLQQSLGNILRQAAASTASPSSLQLTLENPELAKYAGEYVQSLESAPLADNTAIGYVAVINGSINSAEVYASANLFRQAWPKLLNSLAVESLTQTQAPQAEKAASEAELNAFIQQAEAGAPASREVNARTKIAKYESPTAVLFETRDQATSNWVHRSYFVK